MFQFVRKSLLIQLLGVYLAFVLVVLSGGWFVNVKVQEQLQAEILSSDLALAQTIALETDTKLRNARDSLVALSQLDELREGDARAIERTFRAFKTARSDVDRVYFIDPEGILRVSVPSDVRTLGANFSAQPVFQRVQAAQSIVVEAGVVDLTTFNAVAVLAHPLFDGSGNLLGVVATNLALDDFSVPLRTVIAEQARQEPPQRLLISILDNRGHLIATPERERLLQPVVHELPGAAEALDGLSRTQIGAGPRGDEWLFSSVPIPSVGWAVVVQRPAADALAVVHSFNQWLTTAALLFGIGGLIFWVVLARRVIDPLSTLAARHTALTPDDLSLPSLAPVMLQRGDEIGGLARSLNTLEHDVARRLAELRTLLETSSVVVGTLDPRIVAGNIIREVQRLVDVQAAAVIVPDDQGILRVLASAGRSPEHDRSLQVSPDSTTSPSAQALREKRPVQLIAGKSAFFPEPAYADGLRAMLAIPIISHHVGGVVLVVHRTNPQPFDANEVDLLLTFANYATLAWEHAVLYERSDERLREVALENERLYRRAQQEQRTLAAIMSSMSDGLILTSVDGQVLYANPGAGAMIGIPAAELVGQELEVVYAALQAMAIDSSNYDAMLARPERRRSPLCQVEIEHHQRRFALQLRFFDVYDGAGQTVGRGLLLRDVTREREIDQFKTTLLGAVGHEVRTPLAAIKGYASTLLQDDVAWSAADERHFLQSISSEADRLAQLVTNLLDLSRLEAGLVILNRAPCQIPELVRSVAHQIKPTAAQLDLDLPAYLPAVEIDGPRIEVVLRNVLANALAYGDGRVLVRAYATANGVVVQVIDDGPGVAAADLPYIFERFYRAQRGLQTRSGGTGLGLAISKAFVEAHGGRIWAENNHPGLTVAFSLPVTSDE